MDTVAFIFARSGSKGLINKNIKKFHNKPLIGWSIDIAKSIKSIRRVIVSTDSLKIANIAIKLGAEVPFIRPIKLAKDDSPEWLAWKHALNFLKKSEGKLPEAMLSIPSTSPLRNKNDIKKCLALFYREKPDAVITITKSHRNPFFNMVKKNADGSYKLVNQNTKHVIRRQDAEKVYDITTVAYVMNPKFVLNNNSLFNGIVKAVEIPIERSIDIDSRYDFEVAKFLMTKKKL